MKHSFTLLELMIVVIIVGVLATLGIQQYIPSRERAMSKEAQLNLRLISAAEKIYKMENETYYPNNGTTVNDIATINTNLKLNLTANNWAYKIIGTSTGYTASADRNGSGGYLSCQWGIDQASTDPTVSSGTCAQ